MLDYIMCHKKKPKTHIEINNVLHLKRHKDKKSFWHELSYDELNEGSHIMNDVEQYHKNFGHYPSELLADKIFFTRAIGDVL